MLIEESELRLGLVGLGRLTEYAAMTLFADAQAHALTAGTGGTLREITDVEGTPLYPGYFWTHVTVPPERRLERHQIWDRVAVGVDVRSWGPVLESSYVLGTPAELALAEGARPALPAMRAASMFFVADDTAEAQPARPKQGTIAEVAKLAQAPAAAAAFREVRLGGVIDTAVTGRLRLAAPVVIPIIAGRDASVGHSMMFAQFVRIFDLGERALLTEHLRPPIDAALVDHLAVVERQVYYLDNCGPGASVAIDAHGRVERCAPNRAGTPDEITAALVRLALSAHDALSGRLLAVSTVTKLLIVPRARPSLLHAAERFCRQHGEDAP